MLNVFPIQFLALFAYFILRVAVGFVLMYLGFSHIAARFELSHILRFSWWPFGYTSTMIFAAAELILACMFIFGALTQIAALVTFLMCVKLMILQHYFVHPTIPSRLFYILLAGASFSLFITGAGVFAVDLPL